MGDVESTELPLNRTVHIESIAQPIVGGASGEGRHTHGYEKLFSAIVKIKLKRVTSRRW